MLLVSSALSSSASLGAQLCGFYDRSEPLLVINKHDRVELYSLSMRLVTTFAIHDSVLALAAHDSALHVLTARYQLLTIDQHSTTTLDLNSSTTAIKSDYTFLSRDLVYCYQSILYAIVDHEFLAITLPVLNVLKITEIDETALAILHTVNSLPVLSTFTLDVADRSLTLIAATNLNDVGSQDIINIPNEGLVVIGEVTLRFIPATEDDTTAPTSSVAAGKKKEVVEFKKQKRSNSTISAVADFVECKMPVGMIQAWCTLLSQSPKADDSYLLGDIYGKLFWLTVVRDTPLAAGGDADAVKSKIIGLNLRDLGDTSSPTSLVPLSDSTVYLGSRFGDSQLIQLPTFISRYITTGSNRPSSTTIDNERTKRVTPTNTLAEMEIDDSSTGSSTKRHRAETVTTVDGEDPVDEEGDEIKLLESYTSLAPILDCCVIENDLGGASQIVTCSGAYKGGSLRVIRQGVGLKEIVNVDLEGILNIFPLTISSASNPSAVKDDLLVLSFFNSTRILKLSSNAPDTIEEDDAEAPELEMEEILIDRFNASSPTLLAFAVGAMAVQVTSTGVVWTTGYSAGVDAKTGEWKPSAGKKITLAANLEGELCLALAGGDVVLLSVDANGAGLSEISTTNFPNEIACFSLSTINIYPTAPVTTSPSKKAPTRTTRTKSIPVLSVGLWTTGEVYLLSLPSLSILAQTSISSGVLVRSIRLVDFGTTFSSVTGSTGATASGSVDEGEEGARMLFCGMGDGKLVSFRLDVTSSSGSQALDTTIAIIETSRKSVVLGKKPLLLSLFTTTASAASTIVPTKRADGKSAVTEVDAGAKKGGGGQIEKKDNLLVSSDRPTIVSFVASKLVFSTVNLSDTIALTAFTPSASSSLPSSCLALATPSSLKLGQINSIQKVDVLTISLEEDEPRRIAYEKSSGTVGVVCLGRDVDRVSGKQSSWGCFKVFDGESFEILANIALKPKEEGQSISVLSRPRSETSHTSREDVVYLVGTAFVDSADTEPRSGRLLVVGFVPTGAGAEVDAGEGKWEIISEVGLKGCPYAVQGLSQGCFAVAVSSQVTIYSLSASNEVDLLTSWSGAFIALTLSVVPSSLRSGNADEILVGDAIRSMILLQFKYKPGSPKLPTLQEVARDYRGKYLTAAEWVDYPTPSNVGSAARGQEVEDEEMGEATDLANAGADSGDKGKTTSSAAAKSGEEFIGAEIDLNLFTVRKEDVTTNRSMEDEYTLSPRGEFHLGEMVSKFVRGTLAQQFDSTPSFITPKLIYVTSAGSIGVISKLDTASSKVLSDLERNIRSILPSVGNLRHEDFRAPKSPLDSKIITSTPTPATGFIDGSFIEKFSELSNEEMDKVLAGASEFEKIELTREELIGMVEEVGRMH